jgi:type I restriction enzyme M protein
MVTSRDAGNGANLGFEQTLWAAADKLRGHLDAAEYKHVVLGLIFLKYISDAFEARRQQLLAEVAHGADPEDPDEYRAESVFWVPMEARWKRLQANAKDPQIGSLLDKAMDAIEHENPSLRGVLPREYNKPSLDKRRLGELVDLISSSTAPASRSACGSWPATDPVHPPRVPDRCATDAARSCSSTPAAPGAWSTVPTEN